MASERVNEIFEIDRFLGDPKKLVGPHPRWGRSTFFSKSDPEMEAQWSIADALGIIGNGQLRFAIRPGKRKYPSVSVVYAHRPIFRIDLEEADICESNPIWAQSLGVPARVCGSHVHTWEHNRQHIIDQEKWEISCRVSLSPRIKKLDQTIAWLASQINISLEPDQHGFSLPYSLF